MRLLLCLLLILLPASSTLCARDVPGKEETHKWNWLTEADKARLLASIPPAPEPGSDLDQRDLAEVLKLQSSRSPQEIASAMDDQHFRFEMVTKVLAPAFTPENYPTTFALLKQVIEDEGLLNSTLKKRYKRLRPYQAHPEVKPLFEVEQFSYPSGHSSGAHVLAAVLEKLFPERKGALEARADSVGQGRIIAGVHYPSDVDEGKKLAQALTDALLSNPGFQKDLAGATKEVTSRGSSKP